jgi:hypothetical protein
MLVTVRGSRTRLLVWLGTASLVCACSAITSFSELTGGDAGGSGTDAAANDATADGAVRADGTASDSAAAGDTNATSSDAGGDQGAPTDATFCPYVDAQLCDDFERATLQGPWTNVISSGGGTLALAPSPLGGTLLHASIPTSTGASNRWAFLQYDTVDTFTEGDVSFDVVVPPVFDAGQYHIMALQLIDTVSGITNREIDITMKPTTTSLAAHATYADGSVDSVTTPFSTGVTPGVLVHLRVHVKLSAIASIDAYLNGTHVASTVLPIEFAVGRVELHVGMDGPNAIVPAMTGGTDNVVLAY